MSDCQGHNEHHGDVREYCISGLRPTKRQPNRIVVLIPSIRLCQRCAEVSRNWKFITTTVETESQTRPR